MRKHAIKFTQPTLTQQHSRDEVDINNIMKRYQKTGVIDHVSKYEGQYGENNSIEYHEGMNIIAEANSMFLDLPATTRKAFNNDPAKFLDFVENPENIPQLHEMGLTNNPPQSNTSSSNEPPPPTSPDQPGKTPSEKAPASTAPAD